ncbi:transporter substrate-binding domain-containing protein [Camelliibacillus cellulosilyticus]|uniref:Transporter substrate-binding domain-containing protein n=1 Tax=Camelliibacillus cellulosilyticus TaxID=2174486 RepID=A0ABV9GMW7_9BACL
MLAVVFIASLVLTGCGNDNKSASGGGGSKSTLDKIKSRGKLIVGVKYDVNLFGLKDPKTGKVEGYDADLARELAKKIFGKDANLNKVLELKQVNSKTRFDLVNNGTVDLGIATCTINDERKQKNNFSQRYFKAGQSLLVKKGSPIKSIDDLNKSTRVLSVKGSTSEQNVKEKAPDAPVQLFDDYAQAFSALKAGKGDVLTTDNAILIGMHKEDPNYVLVGGLFTDEPYGIILKKNDDDFTKYVNDFLHELKDNGKLDELYKKWFGEPAPDDLLQDV